MASKCIDLKDQIVQSRQRVGSAPTSKSNGELNVYAIDNFKAEFLEGIQKDGIINPIDLQIDQHGDSFYKSLSDLNAGLSNQDLSNYPELEERLKAGPISAIEHADFCGAYNYAPPQISTSPVVLGKYNSYYRDPRQSVLGGFCAMMPQFFNAVNGFFTIIGSVAGLINDALSFLTKLRNLEDPIKEIIEKLTVTALINQIKEKITEVVEETFKQVKEMVENFSLENVVGEVETFIKDGVFGTALKIKDAVLDTLSEENMKKITDKIKGLFDYAVGLFSNPSLEEIQFLIARFCAFVGQVEGLIRDVKTPMDNYAFKYQRIVGRLQRVSNLTSARAVSAGAIRFDSETRKKEINRMKEQWKAPGGSSPGNNDLYNASTRELENIVGEATRSGRPFDSREIKAAAELSSRGEFVSVPTNQTEEFVKEVQAARAAKESATTARQNEPSRLPDVYTGCEGVNVPADGTGATGGTHHTPTGQPPNNIPDITPEEIGVVPSWDDIKDGNHPKIQFTSGIGKVGWTGLAVDTRVRLMRLQELTGRKLIINSGKRTEQYQDALRKRYKAQGKSRGRFTEGRGWNYGVAFYSQHLSGKAVDVSWATIPNRQKFIDDARRCGFTWMKMYSSFIHIDTRDR